MTTWHTGEADDWKQSAKAMDIRFNEAFVTVSSSKKKQCVGSTCERISTYLPIELFRYPAHWYAYGLWVAHNRSKDDDCYVTNSCADDTPARNYFARARTRAWGW